MLNPLNSIKGTLITGFILAVIVMFLIKMGLVAPNWMTVLRWLHIIAGITWIGLLYYFNFVQTPALAKAAADQGGPGGAGISKYVAPLALLWFRWSALITWLLGFSYLASNRQLGAFLLGFASSPMNLYQFIIGMGAWFGTIMLFNVWVLIWPNQKIILGIVSATDEQKAKARKVAFLASRTNVVLSIPMLLCMAAAGHGL